MRILFYACLVLVCTFNETTWAYGENGHRVVGQIAESRLTAIAKGRVAEILGQESLAEASTWGDEVRSDTRYSKYDPWHYVEIPDGHTYANSPKNPKGDLIVAIQTTMEVLSGKSTKFPPKEALRYLVHFVGDLHQPLHVGNGQDQGGNLCVVKYAGRNTNLHVVWDSHLIEDRSLSYTEMTNFLNRSDLVTTAKIRKWTTGTILDWAHESMKIRDSLYPPPNEGSAMFLAAGEAIERNYCKKSDDESIPTARIPKLGFEYEYKNKKILDEQLTKAGIRLSYLLNDIFR